MTIDYTEAAEKKSTAAAALYEQGELSVNEIAGNLGISKATLYKYLRHRGVNIGQVKRIAPINQPRTLKVNVHMIVENNSKHVRGKSRSLKDIEETIFAPYNMRKPDPKGYEYELTFPYVNDKELDDAINDIVNEAASTADQRNGYVEMEVLALDGTDRCW